jgi:hypothetical protein
MRLATLCTNRQICCLPLHVAVSLTPAVDSVWVWTCYSCYATVESVWSEVVFVRCVTKMDRQKFEECGAIKFVKRIIFMVKRKSVSLLFCRTSHLLFFTQSDLQNNFLNSGTTQEDQFVFSLLNSKMNVIYFYYCSSMLHKLLNLFKRFVTNR